jgi:hypothetical protein
MGVTSDALDRAESRLRLEMEMFETSRNERNQLVREAIAQGWRHHQVAEATGPSRARVGPWDRSR